MLAQVLEPALDPKGLDRRRAVADVVADVTLVNVGSVEEYARTLLRIIDMAGLSGPTLLGRASPITLFAPTDEAFRAMSPAASEFVVLPETISKEPLAPVVRQRETMALPKLLRRLVMVPSGATVEASASIGPWKR